MYGEFIQEDTKTDCVSLSGHMGRDACCLLLAYSWV
jgi:hypothetical protein